MKKVLIIEDDMDAANVLESYLKREQFKIAIAGNGKQGLDLALNWQPDIILLDIMLPEMNGNDVLFAIRRRNDVPVIMITAIGDETDKVSTLRFGADDYVVKPYNPKEVIARVHAVLRRYYNENKNTIIEYKRLKADTEAMTVSIKDADGEFKKLDLTPTELMLLITFMKSPNKAFSRQALIELCLPDSDALERVIDTHIYNLRKKLDSEGERNLLTNVRGIGYRFALK